MKTITLNPADDQSRVRLALKFACPLQPARDRRHIVKLLDRRLSTALQRQRLDEAYALALDECRHRGIQVVETSAAPPLRFLRPPQPGEDTGNHELETGSHELGLNLKNVRHLLKGTINPSAPRPRSAAKIDRRFKRHTPIAQPHALEGEPREPAAVEVVRHETVEELEERRREKRRAASRRAYQKRKAKRLEAERVEQERLAAERAEAERQAALAAERVKAERQERERQAEAELRADRGYRAARRQWRLEREARK